MTKQMVEDIIEGWERLVSLLEDVQDPADEMADGNEGSRETLYDPSRPDRRTHRSELLDPSLLWDGQGEPLITEPSHDDTEGVEGRGVDDLAYYRSFHFGLAGWGIYIKERGLHYVASHLDDAFDPLFRVQAAFRSLHSHEYFHFLTDVAATTLEVASHRPLYRPYIRSYRMRHPPWNKLEEAMGNSYALARFRGSPLRGDIVPFMMQQPAGYCDFRSCPPGLVFRRAMKSLVSQILDPDWPPGLPPELFALERLADYVPFASAELLFDTRELSVSPWDVPIYILRDPPRLPEGVFRLIQVIPHIRETTRFHSDLRKLPRGMAERWKEKQVLMREDVRHPSLNFEKLRNCDTVFSVRVSRAVRATLRPAANGEWEALRIGNHDDIYRRPL